MAKNNIFWQDWLNSSLGQHLLTTEKQSLQWLNLKFKIYSENLLLLGSKEFIEPAQIINSKAYYLLNNNRQNLIMNKAQNLKEICARQDHLPIIDESIDLVYLAHSLELAVNPHEVLREAYRVLKPEGYLVVTSFNPHSFWGWWRLMIGWLSNSLWNKRFFSRLQLKDWLQLLGFELSYVRGYCFNLPINNQSFLVKFSWIEKLGRKVKMPFGGSNLLLARKRLLTLTPLRALWQHQRQSTEAAASLKPTIIS